MTGCANGADTTPGVAVEPDTSHTAGAPVAVALETLRGRFTFGHEVRTFRSCGSSDVLWVTDRTGLLESLHKELLPDAEPYEAVFTVVRGTTDDAPGDGFAADYDGSLVITDVLYVAHEGLGCESDWDFRFRAAGNEPFWSLYVTRGGLRLSRPGQPDETWSEYELESDPDGVRITDRAGPAALVLEIRRDSCRDSMSGAFSPFVAVLRVGDLSFSGCGVEGLSGGVD